MIPESTAERAPVSRQSVVDAALGLLAEGGLDAVSFRRIARVLGVSGPTLYWHVENKRQLMDLMADELLRRSGRAYAGPDRGQPWWEWLQDDARRMFHALIATRDAPRAATNSSHASSGKTRPQSSNARRRTARPSRRCPPMSAGRNEDALLAGIGRKFGLSFDDMHP